MYSLAIKKSTIYPTHRYLRKLDYICLWNFHLSKTGALIAGTKQSRQAWNRLGSPDCPVNLAAWSAHLSCRSAGFVLCLLLVPGFQSVFLRWQLTVLARQTRQVVDAYKQSIFNMMSMTPPNYGVIISWLSRYLRKWDKHSIIKLDFYFRKVLLAKIPRTTTGTILALAPWAGWQLLALMLYDVTLPKGPR